MQETVQLLNKPYQDWKMQPHDSLTNAVQMVAMHD